MIINVVGAGDNRPVIYALLKVCQTFGDVLLISDRDYVFRLSNTGESGGHYQNVMVTYATGGIDDFLETFDYDFTDFSYTITENSVEASADLNIYVKSMSVESNTDILEYFDDYVTIELYNPLVCKGPMFTRIEEFEALRDMCSMPQALIEILAENVAKAFSISTKNFIAIASKDPTKAPSPTFHDYVKLIKRRLKK